MNMKKTILTFLVAGMCLGNVYAQDNAEEPLMDYRRSSLYSVLVSHNQQKFAYEIGKVFLEIPTPDKYNDHNLSVRIVSMEGKKPDVALIEKFIKDNGIASRLVARWFNRDPQTGVCDVELVKQRGLYDASEFDKELAMKSQRGLAMLEDAGEDLIANTFIVVNDIRYLDRGKAGQGAAMALRLMGTMADILMQTNTFTDLGDSMGSMMETLKGFKVKVETHLYQLVWDEETSMKFYTDFYASEPDKAKVKAFEQNRDLFKLKYVGMQESSGRDVSFMGVNLDEPEAMIRKACQRAIDENIASLQKNFEVFQVKTPLQSVAPIYAPIGLKEGITEDSRFEVLEAVVNKEGKVEYEKVGEVKPMPGLIWDNRYMAAEEGSLNAGLGHTTFKKISGKDFYPGMLIREIK